MLCFSWSCVEIEDALSVDGRGEECYDGDGDVGNDNERDYEGRGQAWFETSIRDLFVVMKGLPHEHDSAFLDLLRAMQPGLDQLISSIAHIGLIIIDGVRAVWLVL